MANNIYVDSAATGANNGTTKTDAFTVFINGVNAAVAGDYVWVSHTHNQVSLTIVMALNDINIISVDFSGSTPPVKADWLFGALMDVVGGGDAITTLRGYINGIFFKVDDDFANTGDRVILEDCKIELNGAADKIVLLSGHLFLINTEIKTNDASNSISATSGGALTMKGGSFNTPGAMTTLLTGSNFSVIEFTGIDFSGINITQIVGPVGTAGNVDVFFIGCKLDPSTPSTSPSPPQKQYRVMRLGTHDTNKPYFIQQDDLYGNIISETTIVKSGGSSDGTTPISLKHITNGNVQSGGLSLSLAVPILFWAATTGNNTFTLDLLTDGLTLTKLDAWIESVYPQAGSEQKLFATSKDGGNLAASTATWNTTGIISPSKQKIEMTVNVGQAGWVEVMLYISIPNSTVYVDLKPVDSGRQFISGQAYINTAPVASDCPPQDEVTFGTVYDFGTKTGNRTDAPESKVDEGFKYGANGTGFTGERILIKGPIKLLKLDNGVKVIKI